MWCGGLHSHLPGQTPTSRETDSESMAGENARGSGGPGGGGTCAVGSPAPSSVLVLRGSERPVLGRGESWT